MKKPHAWNDIHMVRTGKHLFKTLYITLGVFLCLFVVFHMGGAIYIDVVAKKSTDAFHAGISREIDHLKQQGDAIAQDSQIIDRLLANDSEQLIALTRHERNARDVGLIGIADADGVIISRTLSGNNLGQNAFLIAPAGRVVASGASVESIELTGFHNQLFITTARPIIHQSKMIGALFANRLMDDQYARRFSDAHLPGGAQVVFYSKEYGVYGSSFTDAETHLLVNSYFNKGSAWIANEKSDDTVTFKDGTPYFVKNVIFPGLETSPGGALIFIPRNDISPIGHTAIAIITLGIFLSLMICGHMRFADEERGWRYYVLVGIASVVVFGAVITIMRMQNSGFARLQRIPYILYNSTMRLQPESGVYDNDFEQRIDIVVDTGDEAINAVEAGLVFDPEAVQVKTVDTTDSVCSYVIENSFDNQQGIVRFSCVVVKSAVGQGTLTAATLVVTPKRTGSFVLRFDDTTKVLANDGLGTNVLRMTQSGSYRVEDFDFSSEVDTETANEKKPLVVFSPTHTNQARWYNAPEARFIWRGKNDQVYRYAFDTVPDTIPAHTTTIQGSSITLPIPGDGIFYFHLQSVDGGPIAHYRIQVDMTPPSITTINTSSSDVVAGDVVRVSFDAKDTGSGIQKNYYVDLGDHLFLPVGKDLFVPFLEAGDQTITLRVYDDAGNYSEKVQVVRVESK